MPSLFIMHMPHISELFTPAESSDTEEHCLEFLSKTKKKKISNKYNMFANIKKKIPVNSCLDYYPVYPYGVMYANINVRFTEIILYLRIMILYTQIENLYSQTIVQQPQTNRMYMYIAWRKCPQKLHSYIIRNN